MVKDSEEEEGEPQEDDNDKDWEPGEEDEDYGGYEQLFQGIDDTIYAYRGDNKVNGFDSDYDPLEEALYEPGGPRTRPQFRLRP